MGRRRRARNIVPSEIEITPGSKEGNRHDVPAVPDPLLLRVRPRPAADAARAGTRPEFREGGGGGQRRRRVGHQTRRGGLQDGSDVRGAPAPTPPAVAHPGRRRFPRPLAARPPARSARTLNRRRRRSLLLPVPSAPDRKSSDGEFRLPDRIPMLLQIQTEEDQPPPAEGHDRHPRAKERRREREGAGGAGAVHGTLDTDAAGQLRPEDPGAEGVPRGQADAGHEFFGRRCRERMSRGRKGAADGCGRKGAADGCGRAQGTFRI
mmetsp:Transcript_51735/g.109986  ORF Transcript_51735/g.109986 Transcript_51735/m.109986 type:complete len:264 (-) Transcript_51735:56-847(-)